MSFYYQRFNNRLKYGNIRTENRGGKFDSKKEARKWEELEMMKKGGAIKDFGKQLRLSLDVNGVHIANYFLDFWVENNDGSLEYIEIKSPITCTDVWKLKWKLAQAIFTDPNIKWVVEM
jgi:hypothetical protein